MCVIVAAADQPLFRGSEGIFVGILVGLGTGIAVASALASTVKRSASGAKDPTEGDSPAPVPCPSGVDDGEGNHACHTADVPPASTRLTGDEQHAVHAAVEDSSSPTSRDSLQCQAEERLLAALGYDDTLADVGADGISEDDIAAFKARLPAHRRTPSGSVIADRYKDRCPDSKSLLAADVSRWQQSVRTTPESPTLSTTPVVSVALARQSSHATSSMSSTSSAARSVPTEATGTAASPLSSSTNSHRMQQPTMTTKRKGVNPKMQKKQSQQQQSRS